MTTDLSARRHPSATILRCLVGLVAAAVVLGGVAVVSASSATAAGDPTSIPDAVTSASLTTGTGPYATGSEIDFSGTWSVPDNSQAGDTFNLQLPSQLSWAGSTKFDLTDAAGDVVATADVSSSGDVVFTLTPYVTAHPDGIGGTFTFGTIYSAQQAEAGPEVLTFTVGATAIPITVTDAGPNGFCTVNCDGNVPSDLQHPFKAMLFTDSQQTETRSYIAGNDGSATSNTVTITDNPGPGLAIDCTSINPQVGHYVDAFADIVAPTDTSMYTPTVQCSSSALTVAWTGLPAQENVGVYLDTTITDQSLPSYSNDGTFVVNGTNTPVAATVTRSVAAGTGDGNSPTPTPTTPGPTSTPTPTDAPTPTPTPTATAPAVSPTPTPSRSSTRTPVSQPTPLKTAPSDLATEASSSDGRGVLAFTGSNPAVLVLLGAGAIGIGLSLLLALRRRRSHK